MGGKGRNTPLIKRVARAEEQGGRKGKRLEEGRGNKYLLMTINMVKYLTVMVIG